jgi:DNA polymerase sigma
MSAVKPSKKEVEEMKKFVSEISSSLKKATQYSGQHGFHGYERTLLHVISHIQTIQEGLSETDPGFSL